MSNLRIFAALLLILTGILGRLFLTNYVGIPNFEIITALTLVSAVFLGRVWAIAVPLSIIAITDVFIGNSPVLIFTWSAFAIIGVFGMIYKKYESKTQKSTPTLLYKRMEQCIFPLCKGGLRGILGITSIGIISSIFFFLYTNFGWWLVSNMYPHTLDGLTQCYIMGLPFFKNNLIGNLIFVPIFSSTAMLINDLRCRKFYGNLSYFKQRCR